jgi:hypothetical protein
MTSIKLPLILKIAFGFLLLFSFFRESINETLSTNVPRWPFNFFFGAIIIWTAYINFKAGTLKSYLLYGLLLFAIMAIIVLVTLAIAN